jgi:hypothetical protein
MFENLFYSFYYSSEHIKSIAIEIKTPPLRMIGSNGYFQCIGLSKRPDFISNVNDTYMINVDGKLRIKMIDFFQNIIPL